VIKRKDLVVLYVVTSLVTSPTITINLTVLDARKYIYNETELIGLTWVPKDVDVAGHFKSIDSVITWVNKFGSVNDIIKVRGEFDFTSTLDLTAIKNPIKLLGEGATFNIVSPKGIIIKSNVSFDNITFNYNPVGFTANGNITSEHGCIFGDTATTGGLIADIAIKNCQFNSQTSSHPPYMSFRVGSGEYINNIDILDNEFSDSSGHAAAISFLGSYNGWTAAQAGVIGNVNVIGNNCLQDQVFYFVNSYSIAGNSYSIPGLTAVNVKVHDNKFGYLGLNVSGNNKYASAVTGEQLFSVDNNQLIAVVGPLDETGRSPFITAFGATGSGLPTGNVVISNNELSFIITEADGGHPAGVDGYIGHLDIHNNVMYANSFTNTVSPIFQLIPFSLLGGAANVGIYVGTRHYSAPNNQICVNIQNNYMDGKKINDVYFGYGGGITSQAPALVSGNTIKGLVNVQDTGVDIGYGIRLDSGVGGFSKVHHNAIYRGSVGIKGYVYLFAAEADITDNFFDSSYVDAANTNDNVVAQSFPPTPNRTIVTRNKNQLITTCLQGNLGIVGFGGGLQMGSGSGGPLFALVQSAVVIRQSDSNPNLTLTPSANYSVSIAPNGTGGTSSVASPFIDWTISIKELLPEAVTLVSATVQALSTASGATGDSQVSIIASKLGRTDISPTTFSTSHTLGNPYIANSVITITVDLSTHNYKVGQSDIYNFIRILVDGSTYTGVLCYSSMIIKYKW
jgi:hypothetical protein